MQSRKLSKNTEEAALILPWSNQDKFTENQVEPGLDLWIRLSRCRKDGGKEHSKHKQKLQGCYQAAAVSGRSGEVWVFRNSLREGGSQRQHLGRGGVGGGGVVGPGEPSKAPDGRSALHPPTPLLQQQVIQEYGWCQIGVDFLSRLPRCSRKGYQQLRLRAVK